MHNDAQGRTSKHVPTGLPRFQTLQDPQRKHFLALLPKLQPWYDGEKDFLHLHRNAPIFATFTNAAPVYVEQLLNWAYHLRDLQLPHVVVCLDTESEEIAASNGIPWLAVANKTTSEDVRNDHATFRAMVSRKVDFARLLMGEHGFQEVIWTDTDVAWLRDPRPYFAAHPSADLAVQTDCLSHAVEASFTGMPFTHGVARCGHLPGNTYNNAFNTGMILFRDRPQTHAFLRSWLEYLLDANRMFVDLGGGTKAVVGDQLAFNTLVTEGSKPWKIVSPNDPRVVWAHNHTVQFMPLPTLMFSGGHSFFVQHLAVKYNTTPFYAHACLVPGHVPAKVARFKEHNLWAIEDDEYYTRGNFLFYENTVRAFVTMLDARAAKVLPDLYKHMLAVSYQMAVILEMAAVAHALDRIVIFPRFWCWCDSDWYAVVLDGCAMGGRPGVNGADLEHKPFECPIDVVLNPHMLYHSKYQYRQERFLAHRRVPSILSNSREPVLVIDQRDTILTAYRDQMMRNTHTGVYVPTGVTDEGLRSHLVPWISTRVLDFRNALPGTFGGFTDPGVAVVVDQAIFPLFTDKKWCCSGEQPMDVRHLEWPYTLPERLEVRSRKLNLGDQLAPYQPFALPVYARPTFCADILTDPKNAKFLEFSNHPCTFLAMEIALPHSFQELFALNSTS